MLKIAASYSKKVPGAQEYSSEGFLVSLEAEVPEALLGDPGALQGRIQGLFQEARGQVEAQVRGSNGSPAGRPQAASGNGWNREPRPASPKQIQYLLSLAKRKLDLSPQDVAQHAGVRDLRELSTARASELIESLKAEAS